MRNFHSAQRMCAALLLLAIPRATRACDEPVFRYALERWPADVFEAVVFQRGPLSDDDKAVVDRLKSASIENDGAANLIVRQVDLSGETPVEIKKLWAQQKNAKPPYLVVRFPFHSGIMKPLWSGPLAAAPIDALLDSPLRRRLARRLLKGDAAVMILLECGDKKKDDAAAKKLAKVLKQLKKELESPDEGGQAPAGEEAFDLRFPVFRLSRKDPQERILVNMLLKSEEDLEGYKEPMVFPIYGRARVLWALVGPGINEQNLANSCMFLVGQCSCEVKAMNPGTTDLLMNVDWDAALMDVEAEELAPAPSATGLPAETRPRPKPAASTTAKPAASAPEPSPTAPMLWNTVLVIAAGVGIVVGLAIVMLLRGRERS